MGVLGHCWGADSTANRGLPTRLVVVDDALAKACTRSGTDASPPPPRMVRSARWQRPALCHGTTATHHGVGLARWVSSSEVESLNLGRRLKWGKDMKKWTTLIAPLGPGRGGVINLLAHTYLTS